MFIKVHWDNQDNAAALNAVQVVQPVPKEGSQSIKGQTVDKA